MPASVPGTGFAQIAAVWQAASTLRRRAHWSATPRFHMDFATLRRELPRIGAKRVALTHMSADMLDRDPQAFGACTPAFDGMELVI